MDETNGMEIPSAVSTTKFRILHSTLTTGVAATAAPFFYYELRIMNDEYLWVFVVHSW